MKKESGIRSKSGYALGFALAAGIALTTTLIAHAQQADAAPEAPSDDVVGPTCDVITTCDTNVTGFFVKQKPDLACVYQCSSVETCTTQNQDCIMTTTRAGYHAYPSRNRAGAGERRWLDRLPC